MSQTDNSDYSTQRITPQLITQIIDTLKNKAWGSIEIYVENFTVTQITERTITKVAKPNGQKMIAQPKNGQNKTQQSSLSTRDLPRQ